MSDPNYAIAWSGVPYDKNDLHSMNNVIRNEVGGSYEFDSSLPFETNFIDIHNHHTLFLHIPSLTTYKTLSLTGADSIVKKIPVTTTFGNHIFDSVVSPHDYIHVGGLTLSNLKVQLKDALGRLVKLNGAHISFSLVFELKQ